MMRQDTTVLIKTLLPLPVAPAISRCGILARSSTTVSPPLPLPRTMGSFALARSLWNSSLSITLRSVTSAGVGFGTSMPT